jgi:hypothetical protein
VLVIDYFVMSRRRWDLSETAPARWAMLVPWFAGFVAYQMINPGYIVWWTSMWRHIDEAVGFTPSSWMSASLVSFFVAAIVTVPVGLIERNVRAHPSRGRGRAG